MFYNKIVEETTSTSSTVSTMEVLSSSSSPPTNPECDDEKKAKKEEKGLIQSRFFDWVSKNFAHPLSGINEGGDFESAIYYERDWR